MDGVSVRDVEHWMNRLSVYAIRDACRRPGADSPFVENQHRR